MAVFSACDVDLAGAIEEIEAFVGGFDFDVLHGDDAKRLVGLFARGSGCAVRARRWRLGGWRRLGLIVVMARSRCRSGWLPGQGSPQGRRNVSCAPFSGWGSCRRRLTPTARGNCPTSRLSTWRRGRALILLLRGSFWRRPGTIRWPGWPRRPGRPGRQRRGTRRWANVTGSTSRVTCVPGWRGTELSRVVSA